MSSIHRRCAVARVLSCLSALFVVGVMAAQTTPPPAPQKHHARKPIPFSQFDLMGGYALFHPVESGIGSYSYSTVENKNASASLAGYWDRHWGFQAEGGYFSGGSKREILGQCAPSCASRDQNVYTAEIGPIYRFQLPKGFIPFVHVLGGGARINGPALQSLSWGWATTGGAGIDYVLPILHDHLALRPAQLDYQFSHVNYGPLAPNGLTGGVGNLNAYKFTSGIVLRLGNVPAARQTATLACTVEPAAVLAGDPVRLTTTAAGLNPKHGPTYTLTSTGGVVKQDVGAAEIDTTGLAPGSYTLNAKVSQGTKVYEQATCSTSFAINAPPPDLPPTISCSASPASVTRGQPSTITASAQSPQHHALTYRYSTTAGQVSGTDTIATLETAGVSEPAITVTCSVGDDTGKTVSATTVVQITAAELPPVPQTRNLCAVSFERDRKRPVRVDNEAKGCLDDIALQLNREPDSMLVVVGDFVPGESQAKGAARAAHVKQYLVEDKGIEANRVSVRSTSGASRSAETVLVPVGSKFEDAVR